ncbi:enoyl-CoA hydratase-related protein [Aquamicrobium sp. LC103]|uniref:enoyl-CoA hydratase-related protein n=1 Tax=Aquamicrobium sp. LC103 TaxID=1120658 RepID=UPI0009E52F54|nr:enoyl-CoA hydratase-related protein [Aquamicrobium sp. LC103]TKT69804.1 enoyl-CoA hydratase [Aquamicrobium sp. LC103]
MTQQAQEASAEAGRQFVKFSREGRVAIITLHRPEALNAINAAMVAELAQLVRMMDVDDGIGCLLLKGEGRAFCAGADIKEAVPVSFPGTLTGNYLADLGVVGEIRKPIVATVSGAALGGGCELAMMCDIILADETARFGLPEIRLGTMPGAGGTQRLALALGKAKAMELMLTGRALSAAEAEALGLINRVVPRGRLQDEAMQLAHGISEASLPAVMAIKEAVGVASDGLTQGLRLERRLFHALYATADRREGMQAFAEKRAAEFRHK